MRVSRASSSVTHWSLDVNSRWVTRNDTIAPLSRDVVHETRISLAEMCSETSSVVVTGAGVWYSSVVVVTSFGVVASEVDSVDGSTRTTVVSGCDDVICDNDNVGEIVDDDDDDDSVSDTDVVVVVIVIVVGTVDVNDFNVVYSNGNVSSVVVDAEVVVDSGFVDLVGLVVRRGGLVVRRQYLVVGTGPREVVIRVVDFLVVIRVVDFLGGLYRVVKMMCGVVFCELVVGVNDVVVVGDDGDVLSVFTIVVDTIVV